MSRLLITFVLTAGVLLPPAVNAQSHFSADDIELGRQQFHRTCAQCHGHNMVSSGTGAYDLRRFPTDDPDRFVNSVTNGKGGMPSFKEVLSAEQLRVLWAYIGSRGGKAP